MPHNVSSVNIKLLKDYVLEQKGIFLHPTNEDTEELLQFNKDGKLNLVPADQESEDDSLPDHKTHNLIVGTLRKPVELAHAALKQNAGMYLPKRQGEPWASHIVCLFVTDVTLLQCQDPL